MAAWNEFVNKHGVTDTRAAAPTGVAQQTTQQQPGEGVAADGQKSGAWQGFLNKYDRNQGPAGETGGQWGSTENGWNTPFYQKMFQQRDERSSNGTLNNWYDDKDFTGVATYDYKGDRDVKFGDVYENGQKRGNLFSPDSGYDEQTAYTMMAQLTLDKKEQAAAFKDLRNDASAVKKAVEGRRETVTKEVAGWKTQQEYQGNIQEQKNDWDDGTEAGLTTAAGAAGGAALGAAGFALGPVGFVTTGLGAAIGGFGAWLNRDTLVDQAARASVQTSMAQEQFGTAGALSTGLRTWGGAAMGAISPATNLLQGTNDAVSGTTGDDTSEWYDGERHGALTALGLGAALGDGILQFASGAGAAAFLGTMTATTVGGVGQLATQGGATFDDRRGQFHTPEDAGQAAAAIGGVGIDALQLGLSRGILRSAQNLNTVGGRAVTDQATGVRGLVDRASSRATGREQIGGRTFTLREDGTVERVRENLTLLAPSEATQWLSVTHQARQMAARQGGAVSADDYNQMLYRAAVDLQAGSNLAKSALINAFGEGMEEATQAVLEPLSHGWTPEFEDIAESFFMGAAAGAGMTIGARAGRAGQDQRDMVRANIGLQMAGQPTYTAEDWKILSQTEKNQARTLAPAVEAGMRDLAQKTAEFEVRHTVRTQAGLERSIDAALTARDQELRTLNPALEGTYTISSHQAVDIDNHVVQTSGKTVLEMLEANQKAAEERLAALPVDDPGRPAVEQLIGSSTALIQRLRPEIDQFEAGDNTARVRINTVLRDAWNEGNTPAAKAASVLLSRDPNNSDGSFQLLLPQVGEELRGGNSHGLLQVSRAILKAIDGDYDGDKMRQRVNFRFEAADDKYRQLRLGLNVAGTVDAVPLIDERATEKMQIREVSVAEYMQDASAGNAKAALTAMQNRLGAMLSSVPGANGMIDNLISGIRRGDVEAKTKFMGELARTQPDALVTLGETGNAVLPPYSNVMYAVEQAIVAELQGWTYAEAARRLDDKLDTRKVKPITQAAGEYVKVAAKRAATWGQTFQQSVAGTDAFRAFQKPHYSKYRSPVMAALADKKTEFSETVRLYEQLSAGAQRSVIEDVFAADEVSRTALRILHQLSADMNKAGALPMRTAFLMAGTQVPYYQMDAAGQYTPSSGLISAGQAAIREAVRQLRRRDANLLDSRPELAQKYDALDAMSPGEAIAELFDATPAIVIIGEAANNYAANLTFGQIKADYLNLSPTQRADYRERARSDVRYTDFKHDLPYTLEELENEDVGSYKIFTEALFEVADKTLSFDPATGKVSGAVAERDARVLDTLKAFFSDSRSALKNLAKLNRVNIETGDPARDAANIASLVDTDPRFAHRLMALLPQDIANVVLQVQPDGTVSVPQWFFGMLMQDPKAAAMTYLRHSLIAQLNANNTTDNPAESDDRLVELVLELRQQPARLLQFQEMLYQSNDVETFMRDVNRRFANGAPYLAWHRDAAQFDSSRTKGGWSRELPGAELREAITKARGAAKALNTYAAEELAQDAVETRLVDDILNAGEDGTQFKLLQRRLDDAGKVLQGEGPQAMKIAPLAAALGFFGGATDKGKAPELYAHLGNEDARALGLTQENSYDQLTGALTSFDASDASSNMGAFSRQNARLMDADGRPILWQRLDARKFLELWNDAEHGGMYRPMLRAIAFPTAYEVQADGSMTQQMLTGTSLNDLLNGEIYLRAQAGRTHNDRMTYASMIEAGAVKYGATHSIQRMVSDLVLAWTSKAWREQEVGDLEYLRDEAYDLIVRAIQTASTVDASVASREINKALDQLQEKIGGADADAPAGFVEDLRNYVKLVVVGDIPEDATAEDIAAANAREADYDGFLQDSAFTTAVTRYAFKWDDARGTAEKKQMLWQLLQDNPHYVEAATSPELDILRAATSFDDAGVPVLTGEPGSVEDQELWDGVSRAVLSVWVTEVQSAASTRVPVAAAPKEVTAALIDAATGELDRTALGRAKYWDQSWRYLVDDLLNPDSPVMLAARDFRKMLDGASLTSGGGVTRDFTYAITRILDPEKLGPWNTDIARQSVDAQNRFDSSGAARQVARAGIAYARIAAPAAATQRTYRDPALDGVAPRAYQLSPEATTELLTGKVGELRTDALRANGLPSEPLAFLNGRFTDNVTVSFATPAGERQTIDLLRGSRVSAGHLFQGSTEGRKPPYYGTSLEQIRAAVGNVLPPDAADVTLEVSVFHPADQPAAPEYANNLFFEGVQSGGNGDNYGSLIEGLWMGNGGLNRLLQAAALKANKKGTLALANPELPDLEEVQALENMNDMYGTLRAKTLKLLSTDLGYGKPLDPAFYNAVYKDLKMRHAVRAVVDGQPVLFSADEVIAHQQAGTWVSTIQTAEHVELLALSPRVLRTLLQEQDTQGLRTPILNTPTLDSEGVAPYRNSWTELAANVPGLLDQNPDGSFAAGDLNSTSIVQRSQMNQTTVVPAMDPKLVTAYQNHLRVWTENRVDVDIARAKADTAAQMDRNAYRALDYFLKDSHAMSQFPRTALRTLGIPMDMQGNVDPLANKHVLDMANAQLQATLAFNDRATGWIYSDALTTGNGRRPDGMLHGLDSLSWQGNKENTAYRVLHGDLVVLRLETFPAEEAARLAAVTRVIDKLADLGATIALSDTDGRGLRTLAGVELEARGYAPVAGAGSLWAPRDPAHRLATLEAHLSRMAETREIFTDNHVVTFMSPLLQVEENAALVNNIARKDGREVAMVRDLTPTTGWSGYNTARTASQLRKVQETLTDLAGDPAEIDRLFALNKNGTPGHRAALEQALAKAVKNLDPITGLPRKKTDFGPGDILALIGPKDQIILYRHGFEPPKPADLKKQFKDSKVAIYGLDQMATATTHTGRIVEWQQTNGYGLSVIEAVPLQALGNKTVLERNGMKLIGVAMAGSGVELPDFGPLSNWEIDYLIHKADGLSKENRDGVVNTAQNAIAYLGMDFAPALSKAWFGEDWPADEEAQRSLRQKVRDVLDAARRQERVPLASLASMIETAVPGTPDLKALLAPVLSSTEFGNTGARDAFADTDSPEAQIATAALLYMLAPTARPEHIEAAGGFDAPVNGTQASTILMPELFTQIFDKAPLGSPLRSWFFGEMNARLNNDPARADVGYHLREDWTFVIRNEDPAKSMEGWLQFSEAHSSGDNPTLAEMARDRKDAQQASRQQTLVAEQSLGMRMFRSKKLKKTEKYIQRDGIQEIADSKDLFHLMNGGPTRRVLSGRTRALTPAEQLALRIGREVRLEFQQPVDTAEWTPADVTNWNEIREKIVMGLGGKPADRWRVDSWVRIHLQRPKSADPQTDAQHGGFSYRDAAAALDAIEKNLKNGLFPTFGSKIPAMSFNDVDWMWNNVQRGETTWRLRPNAEGTAASTWEDHVYAALGMLSEGQFDAAWAGVMDGFLHTFRQAGQDFVSLPIALDEGKMVDLLDPETNELIMSMNASRRDLLANLPITDVYNATISDLFNGQFSEGRFRGNYPSANAITNGDKRMKHWRKENDVPTPAVRDLPDMVKNGARYQHQSTTTSPLMRVLVNMRLMTAMFNPFLYAVAPLEMGIRNVLEDATATLTGTGLARKTSEYDARTRDHAKRVIAMMARNTAAKGMLYDEMVTIPKLNNAGPVERFTAAGARAAGKWQDPSYGMPPTTSMKRYVLGAMRALLEQGPSTTLTPNTMLSMLDSDPLALQKNYPQIHRLAINSSANVRMLKATTAGLALGKGLIDPLSAHPRAIINVPSHLMLKLPFMFMPYAANVATNMLGLQGLDATMAIMLSKRPGQRSTAMGKWRAFLSGDGVKNYDPATHDVNWADEVMESIDITNAFIKGGLTHTAVMGLGLLAGSLNITGEDDEDRRRRREAELQGAGYVYDPRDPANDFRNADAVFFDNIPDWLPGATQLKEFFQVQGDENAPGGKTSMANLHWTLKQFISPLQGISRFIDTGNFMNVIWGFEDALGSMPLVNPDSWDEAARLSAELYEASIDAEASGTPEEMAESYGFLLNAVFKLERMLFENAFVNSIYMAADKYDRDPYVIPATDENGVVIRDKLDVPMSTQALQQYLREGDDDFGEAGTIAEGKPGRSWFETQLRTRGESQATLALFGSLFTGFNKQNTLWRYDMAAKERKIVKDQLAPDEAEALVLSLWDPKNEREVLTNAGGEALIRGLRMGTLRKNDPALENVFLTKEQRQAIEASLLGQLAQEAIDMGLDQEATERYVDDTWHGNNGHQWTVPLKDVVWGYGDYEDVIPWSEKLVYRQLNTTYVMGPDGRPWATGIGRDKLNNVFGMAPLQRFNVGDAGNLGVDGRLNSIDETANLNTGMRSLERIDDSWSNPTQEDILKAMEEGFDDVVKEIRAGNWENGNGGYGSGGRGWTNYAKGGGGGYSRGGYSSGGGGGFTFRLNGPERNDATYGKADPYIRADNPIIRRATIRRERFSSDRGRLKPWQ